MYPQLLVSSVLINFVVGNDQSLKYEDEDFKPSPVENKNNLGFPIWKQHFWKPHKKLHRNVTYLDKAENMIRLPKISDDNKDKKKFIKKSPKRVIQKIIKKNRLKTKKIYVIKMISSTTSPVDVDLNQDEMAQWKDESTTVPANQRKKFRRKHNFSKVTRYPMPFQKLQKMKTHRRERRDTSNREDIYILKDFNEMKFLQDDKDFSVVNAHVQKYW